MEKRPNLISILQASHPVECPLLENGEPFGMREKYLEPLWNAIKAQVAETLPPWHVCFAPGALAALRNMFFQQCRLWSEKTVFATIRDRLPERNPFKQSQLLLNYTAQEYVHMWEQILPRYPVTCRLLSTWIGDFVAYVYELVTRTTEAYPRMCGELFHTPPGKVVSVETGDSDIHNGRWVQIMNFERGDKIVYKPRSLNTDIAWGNLLNTVAQMAGMEPFIVPRSLDYGTHGFCEFIYAKPVSEDKGFGEFFFRSGFLLGITHVLQSSDLHAGNLIACGNCPVLVDVETIVRVCNTNMIDDTFCPLYAYDSVQTSKLLPFLSPDKYLKKGIDALSSRVHAFQNLPYNAEGPQTGRQWYDTIAEGFRSAYITIQENTARLLEPDGPLDAFYSCQVRFLIRATAYYGRLQMILGRRESLINEKAFEEKLALLDRFSLLKSVTIPASVPGTPPVFMEKLLDQEKAELRRGYIPCFYLNLNERTPFPSPFKQIIDYTVNKLQALNEEDMEFQCGLIRTLLSPRCAFDGSRETTAVEKEYFMQKPAGNDAGPIATLEYIMRKTLRRWMTALADRQCEGLIVERDSWQYYLLDLPYHLSEGVLGIMLPIAAWYRITCDQEAADALELYASKLSDALSRKPPEILADGFGEGIGGLLRFVQMLCDMSGLPQLSLLRERILQSLLSRQLKTPRPDEKWHFSLFTGESASLMALALTPDDLYTQATAGRVRLLAQRLIHALDNTPACARHGLNNALDGAYAALGAALPLLDESTRSQACSLWGQFIRAGYKAQQDFSLANGLCGHLLARAAWGTSYDTLPEVPFVHNSTFSFGNAGAVYTLTELARRYGDVSLRKRADAYAQKLLISVYPGKKGLAVLGQPGNQPFPSFFHGEGGVLYALLYHLYPESLPSLLISSRRRLD